MDREGITALLGALSEELGRRNVTGEIYIAGGAAIALAFDARRSTRDIDAVFEPKSMIYSAAEAVARDRGAHRDWLNDSVKGFFTGSDPGAVSILELPNLKCSVASPRVLLAMKVLAHRVGEDDDDLRILADALGLTTAEEVLEVAAEAYGDRLDAAARFFVEEAMAEG